jgi:hypothetical protein
MITAWMCGGLLLVAGGEVGREQAPALLVVSAPEIRAEPVETPGKPLSQPQRFQGEQLVVHVQCDAPYWRLVCVAQPLTSSQGMKAPTSGSLTIVSSYGKPPVPGIPGERPAMDLQLKEGVAVPIAEGISTTIVPGGGVRVTPSLLIDPLLPAGTWRGDLKFSLLAEDGKTVLAEQNVRLLFNLPPVGMVLFDKEGLSIHAEHPGDHESDGALRFRVVSNRDGLRVRVTLPGLARHGGGGNVSAGDLAIAVGSSPEDSRARLRQTPYGVNSVVLTAGRGVSEQFVTVRVRSTLSMPPGQYHGIVTAEVIG